MLSNRGTTTGSRAGTHRHRRGMALGAALSAGALLLAACGSSSTAKSSTSKSHTSTAAQTTGLYGALPPSGGTPASGGTVTVAELTGSTPTYIWPLVPSADSSVYTIDVFQDIMWEPLYWSPVGATVTLNKALSLAHSPVFTNGDKTVTITMKPGYTWSANGAPVDANDVAFFVDLVKAAISGKNASANWNNFTPGFFPQNVKSMKVTGKYTIQFNLTRAYNPGYFFDDQLGLLYAFPDTYWNVDSANGPHLTDWSNPSVAMKIYTYLAKQGGTVSTFGTNPLWKDVDGPYVIQSFNSTNGSYVQVPNPKYGGPQKARVTVDAEDFTSGQAALNELKAGTLDFAGFSGTVDPSELPQLKTLAGYSTFGLPDFGFQAAFFNFKDTTDHFNKVIAQLYVRQALAHLEDQPGWVASKGLLDGAGGVDYGPVPAVPPSEYAPANATQNPYPFSVADAKQLLSSHGWKIVPNGTDTCVKPGTGAGECGAGIPAGTPLIINWQYANQPPLTQALTEAYAGDAALAGVKLTLSSKTFNFLIQNDDDPSAPSNDSKWGVVDFGGFTQSLYPTTNDIFNTSGDYNEGGYSNSEADTLIHDSVYGSNPKAVSNEASFLTDNLPVLFQPNPDVLTVIKDTIGGTADSFLTTTQDTFTPQYWYLKKS